MFINAKGFKRLIKQAYNNWGLHIEHIEGMYAIASRRWTMEIIDTHLPKSIKACLIELIGDLPGEGEGIVARKKEAPQEEFGIASKGLEKIFDRMTHDITESNVRFLQDTDWLAVYQDVSTGAKLAINATFADLIDESELNEQEGECSPGYPRTDSYRVIWSNNVMGFMCYKRDIKYRKEQELMNALEETDIVYNFADEELI